MGPHGMLPSVGAYLSLGALLLVTLIVVVTIVRIAVDAIQRRRNIK